MVAHRVVSIVDSDFGVAAIAAGVVEHKSGHAGGVGLEPDDHQVKHQPCVFAKRLDASEGDFDVGQSRLVLLLGAFDPRSRFHGRW